MKKIQTALIMGIIISVITTKVTAQPGVNNLRTNQTEMAPVNEGNTGGYKNLAKAEKSSFRAFNNFKKAFKNESAAQWSNETNLIVATFKKDDVRTKVVYDKKGHWRWTMKAYYEKNMPEDVRSLVKRSIYFDYGITLVKEIKEGDITVYIVDLKNGKKFKQISVYDEEIKVIQEFDLQN